MIVLVTGGRTFTDTTWLHAGMDLLHTMLPGGITGVIEGGAPGADIRSGWWGDNHGVPVTVVKADWEKHGRSAGYIRNGEMAKLKPDVVLVCPGGKGTENMVSIAKGAGLKIVYLERMPVVRSQVGEDLAAAFGV